MSVVSPIIAGAALVPVTWGIATGERPGAVQALGIATAPGDRPDLARRRADARRSGATAPRRILLPPSAPPRRFGLFLVALDYGGEAEPLYTVTMARTAAVLTLSSSPPSPGRRSACAGGPCRRCWSSAC